MRRNSGNARTDDVVDSIVRIYTIAFAPLVLLSVTMSATASTWKGQKIDEGDDTNVALHSLEGGHVTADMSNPKNVVPTPLHSGAT